MIGRTFMFGKNKKEDTTYGIIGLGRFGSALARELAESGADLIVLDQDRKRCGKCATLRRTPLW